MTTRLPPAALAAALMAGALTLSGCSTGAATAPTTTRAVITAAASINAWGSIMSQLGGNLVKTTSIITNPDTDPHDYEPTPADARVIASASLVVENGIGYDSWANKAIAANPSPNRIVINVGKLLGIPNGGNPHRWYSPADVATVSNAITAALTKVKPSGADYFTSQHAGFMGTGLAPYHHLLQQISNKYARTPVGASESIFAPMAQALGLNLITPPTFLRAISEGTEPSAADKATVDSQIRDKKIRVYVFNSQNATPDVAAQVAAAKKAGIAIATVTETLSPAGVTFQQWQSTQLAALLTALTKATTP